MLVVKYPETWAVDHRQRWHAEALQMLGERVIVRHRWNIQDFALGRVQRCTICADSQHVNDNQRVRTLNATGGTFRLQFGDEITAEIPFNQTAEGVKLALEQLDSIEEGDVYTTGKSIDHNLGIIIEFRGNWAYRDDVPLLEADDDNLDVGTVEIIKTQTGAGGEDQKYLFTEVYKQSGSTWCPSCYGVGFEGGFEPIIYVTFALVSDQQAETTRSPSGVIQRADPQVQLSFEPIVQEFDLVARIQSWESDGITPKEVGGRFILREVRPETLRTGPQTADDTPAFAPPEFRNIYKYAVSDSLVIGQTSQMEIVQFETPLNYVPLSPYEERVALVGLVEERKYFETPKAPIKTTPIIKGIE